MIRWSRVLAIARRDLALQLRGRRGWALPAIMAVLLAPAASFDPGRAAEPPRPPIFVRGDVPAEIVGLPDIRVDRRANIQFKRPDPALPMVVVAPSIPDVLRPTLDGPTPVVRVEDVSILARWPRRSLLLGLIAASVLTGALSESIPGERARGTLETLLTAAITRTELVVGKWAAWAGLGAASAMFAAALGMLRGTLEPGWWLLPLPLVPACTVALGLFMVRRSTDVAGGSTVAMRALPGALSVVGVLSYLLGGIDPLLGAALPLGGALLTSGDQWPGPGPALLATAATAATTLACLLLTIRDLEADASNAPWVRPGIRAILVGCTAGMIAWWVPLVGPLLWGAAGNPNISNHLARAPGVVGAALLLLLLAAVEAGGARDPGDALGGWNRRPKLTPHLLVATVAVAVTLACLHGLSDIAPLPGSHFLAEARLRLAAGIDPTWAGPALILSVLSQEIVFRGWLQRAAGPIAAAMVYACVTNPLDPVYGMVIGGLLGLLVLRAGHVWPAIAAHLVGAVLAAGAPHYSPLQSLAIAGIVAIGVALVPDQSE